MQSVVCWFRCYADGGSIPPPTSKEIHNQTHNTMRIEGYPDYSIDIIGNVTSYKRYKNGATLAKRVSSSGYVNVTLSNDDGSKSFGVHRLVAQTYCGNPEGKPIVNHKDSNKQNNHFMNLEWSTYSENIKHGHAYKKLMNK